MSSTQKLFIVNSRTPANAAAHRLHTFTVHWPPHNPHPFYTWQCACGYANTSWRDARACTDRYANHSGVRLPAWPPMDSAVLATSAPLLTGKEK
jgi:hypothetical protein